MKGGDISNRSSPRVVIVWENLIGQLPEQKYGKEARLVARKKWERALDLWVTNEQILHLVLDGWVRRDLNFDVLCTHPLGFAKHLNQRLEREGFPFGHMYNHSLMEFDQQLAYLPNVIAVFHGEENRPFLFGGRGQYLPPGSRFLHI